MDEFFLIFCTRNVVFYVVVLQFSGALISEDKNVALVSVNKMHVNAINAKWQINVFSGH